MADCETTAAATNNARAAAQPAHTFQNPLTLIATSIQRMIAHFQCGIEPANIPFSVSGKMRCKIPNSWKIPKQAVSN